MPHSSFKAREQGLSLADTHRLLCGVTILPERVGFGCQEIAWSAPIALHLHEQANPTQSLEVLYWGDGVTYLGSAGGQRLNLPHGGVSVRPTSPQGQHASRWSCT